MFTAWAIGLQTSAREPEANPLKLERRLLLSYLAAFAAVLVVAAVVVRFTFVTIINQQTATRLQDIARAGQRSVLFVGDALEIDKTETSNTALLTRDQGLQWFDRRGRLVGSQGIPTATKADARSSVTMPILNPRTHQRVGTVRASEWDDQGRLGVHYLDTGLLIGTLLAVVASGAGGLALAHRAVRPVAQSLETLREFTADASHELRGPLTAIASTADAALRDVEADRARDRSRFEAIASAAKQMSRLTSDLLLLASADRSLERDLFVVDLVALLKRLANGYRARFSEAG